MGRFPLAMGRFERALGAPLKHTPNWEKVHYIEIVYPNKKSDDFFFLCPDWSIDHRNDKKKNMFNVLN